VQAGAPPPVNVPLSPIIDETVWWRPNTLAVGLAAAALGFLAAVFLVKRR